MVTDEQERKKSNLHRKISLFSYYYFICSKIVLVLSTYFNFFIFSSLVNLCDKDSLDVGEYCKDDCWNKNKFILLSVSLLYIIVIYIITILL